MVIVSVVINVAFEFGGRCLRVDFGVQGAWFLTCAAVMIYCQVATILGWIVEVLLGSCVSLLHKVVVAKMVVILAIFFVSQLTATLATHYVLLHIIQLQIDYVVV